MKASIGLVLLIALFASPSAVAAPASIGPAGDGPVASTDDRDDRIDGATSDDRIDDRTDDAMAGPENGSAVDLSAGQQLSAIRTDRRANVEREVEAARFEIRLEGSDDPDRVVAERVDELRTRAETTRTRRIELVKAYENGSLSRAEFATRLVELHVQRRADRASAEHLDEVVAAGNPNENAIRELVAAFDTADQPAIRALANALLSGAADGRLEAEVTTEDGVVEIEVRSDDGERRIDRERSHADRDTDFDLGVTEAMEIASDAASDDVDWRVERVRVDADGGLYRVRLTDGFGSEVRVYVDASSGVVVAFEERVDLPAADGSTTDGSTPDESTTNGSTTGGPTIDRDGEIDVDIDGAVERNGELTLTATREGTAVTDAAVEVGGDDVGSTDENGRITVTVPDDDEFDVRIESDSHRGEVEIEFADPDDDPIRLDVEGSIEAGESVTIVATRRGEPVADAEVALRTDAGDREVVGRTDADGRIDVTVPEHGLDVRVRTGDRRGEIEIELPPK